MPLAADNIRTTFTKHKILAFRRSEWHRKRVGVSLGAEGEAVRWPCGKTCARCVCNMPVNALRCALNRRTPPLVLRATNSLLWSVMLTCAQWQSTMCTRERKVTFALVRIGGFDNHRTYCVAVSMLEGHTKAPLWFEPSPVDQTVITCRYGAWPVGVETLSFVLPFDSEDHRARFWTV